MDYNRDPKGLDVTPPAYVALFVSRKATPRAVVGAYDLARGLRDAGVAVAGGFDAPVERDCLKFLLRGSQPILVMPARAVERFRTPAAWRTAMAEGRLTLESPFSPDKRGAPLANARRRNRALADRAAAILIAYAHPGGGVERLALDLLATRTKIVWTLDLPENATLLAAGAHPLTLSALPLDFTAEAAGPASPPLANARPGR